ncbi:MAG: class I SAM-dependent methyltransferase [Candidatus Schekmanbacteria bacterium]|nr:class I SAM-dependent methyltransferase [Candidatus Schekmanbacteria bacterium]
MAKNPENINASNPDRFNIESDVFDIKIRQVIPDYDKLIAEIINAIPFKPDSSISALDIGIGTGAVTEKFFRKFANSQVTGIDLSLRMLGKAANRLRNNIDRVKLFRESVEGFEVNKKYDCIYSNLVLHHLKTDEEKISCYRKIYSSLNEGGFFVNGDIILGKNNEENSELIKRWKDFLSRTFGGPEEAQWWIDRHFEEDFPATVENHILWLKEAGFKNVKTYWTNLNFAVIGGLKE